MGVIAVALGLMQVLDGPDSVLRFYAYTNPDSAVGFFANRNHEAAFLVVGLALAPLWITALGDGATGRARLGAAVAVTLQILLIVGIGVTRSRAGVLIGIAVLLVAASITAASARDRGARRAGLGLLAAALIGAALVGLFARTALVERFHAPIGAELRLQTAPTVRQIAETFFPVGAGLGSFDAVYREAEPLSAVTATYFNHAHDDAMELLVETGAFGLVVLCAFVAWWLWLTAGLVFAPRGRAGGGIGLYASLAVAALMAHSLVDYPLRTTALACLFALACGLMSAPDFERRALAIGTPRL
jgi:O-antigen ligase